MTPVYLVYWRKVWHSGSCRRYATSLGNTGFTEKWQHATRWPTREMAEDAAKRMERKYGQEMFVVEEKRPLPKPRPKNGTMGLYPEDAAR